MRMSAGKDQGRAYRALVTLAALVVVLAGLQAAGDILLPILFSIFLSILALPGVKFLKRIGVPAPIAILFVVLTVALILISVTAIVASTVRSFTVQIPTYEAPLQALMDQTLAQLQEWGIATEVEDLTRMLRPSDVMGLVGQTLNATVAVLSRVVIVTLTMTFILFETSEIAQKAQVAFGADSNIAGPFARAPGDVQRYLFIKTIMSLLTGVLLGAWCYALGLDFALMWGLLAFLLNYIPSIGSILAAIPPIMLALVQLGWGGAIWTAVGYIGVNVMLGNIIEPRLLGRSLGLSPLVVFLSLLFWGWLWGPAGMLLCVPMTVIAKLVLEASDDTRWIAIFLGSAKEVRDGELPPPPASQPSLGGLGMREGPTQTPASRREDQDPSAP